MADSRTRTLYLARHAEPRDGAGLTDRGSRQAMLLGRRLAEVPFTALHHGPLPRAEQTARLVAQQLSSTVPLTESAAAGDYVPSLPRVEDIGPRWADTVLPTLADVDDDEAADGAALAAEAIRLLTGPVADGRESHELVITHAFTVGWLIRHALGAPDWRWWGLHHCHTGLTVIRYFPDRPPTLLVVNDTAHLPAELRWTGFPDDLRL